EQPGIATWKGCDVDACQLPLGSGKSQPLPIRRNITVSIVFITRGCHRYRYATSTWNFPNAIRVCPGEIDQPVPVRREVRVNFWNGSGCQTLWRTAIHRKNPGMPGAINFVPAERNVLPIGREHRRPQEF